MWNDTEHAPRLNRPATAGEALGVRHTEEGLELNTAQAATCRHCGAEPRLYVCKSPSGRDVALWIPAQCGCGGRK